MRRALLLGALLLLATPLAASAQDARKRLADLLVELMDRRTQAATLDTMKTLQGEIHALVKQMVTRAPDDFYNRKLDDLAVAALRAHRPERVAEWEAGMRRRYISQTRAVLRAIRQSLELRSLDEGVFPTTAEGLAVLFVTGRRGTPYLDPAFPMTDAWGRPFVYRAPGNAKPYDLFSLGPDGEEGSTDDLE